MLGLRRHASCVTWVDNMSIAYYDASLSAQLPDLIKLAFSASFSRAFLATFVLIESPNFDSQWNVRINVDLNKRLIHVHELKPRKAADIDGLTTRLLKSKS